ncbi:MAG: MazG family protein [Candidatus Phosphoribacter sp.]
MPARPQPGAAIADLIAVMDRLRSPGGCPWDAQQTHASLVPYLIEETYEAVEAVESDDRAHLVEELGDVLLQVVFHARIGQDDPDAPFDLDDVAAGIAAKLRRRHPHVFGDVVVATPEAVAANWAVIKAAEKAEKADRAELDREATDEGVRRSLGASAGPLDGIPAGMPSLARAAQAVSRLDRAGRGDLVDAVAAGHSAGARLLALVAELVRQRDDPDAALRDAVRSLTAAAG